ncbi:MAG: hypothetical protein PHE96_02275 [Methylococcales bacterium]|nr:hypothetical protein [Methylococcales bacterium]
MTTITFDAHEFIKELKSAGFSEEQTVIITKQHLLLHHLKRSAL